LLLSADLLSSPLSGGAGAGDDSGRPWREVHKTLAHSMKERLEPYRSKALLEREPHEMRGSYDECRFWVKITSRTAIDDDPMRNTGKITFDTKHSGLTFIPGDRLAVMLNNSWLDVEVCRLSFWGSGAQLSTMASFQGNCRHSGLNRLARRQCSP
jgi:hypothetical protein